MKEALHLLERYDYENRHLFKRYYLKSALASSLRKIAKLALSAQKLCIPLFYDSFLANISIA